MRIVVTGATGFIGRHLVPLLQEGGHEVACVLRPGTPCPAGVTLIPADLGRVETIGRLPPADAVIHLAQSARYREFPDAANEIFSVNTASTARLLDLAYQSGVRNFVLASTGGSYSARDGPRQGDAAPQSGNFYAASKLAAEALLPAYARYLRTCALRLFTPYGPGQCNRLIPTLIDRVRSGRAISLDGEAGGLRLSVCFVNDVVSTFEEAVERDWEGTYDVAAPEPTCIAAIGAAIGRSLGVAPTFARTGRPQPPSIVADVTRLAAMRNIASFRSLEAGIDSTVVG